ncbi:hypothetical protein SCHPADRAFT_700807 [Schizopora paradoxa]|uniref:Uncharacterized protein n=1 Tax=Schizopora paradoxa TaxID=27342 RepID=A0A0H2R444_9AGAM|nr:hypothetical protein SCHPADRAFT_700807 [Schizopora paradoxa]
MGAQTWNAPLSPLFLLLPRTTHRSSAILPQMEPRSPKSASDASFSYSASPEPPSVNVRGSEADSSALYKRGVVFAFVLQGALPPTTTTTTSFSSSPSSRALLAHSQPCAQYPPRPPPLGALPGASAYTWRGVAQRGKHFLFYDVRRTQLTRLHLPSTALEGVFGRTL